MKKLILITVASLIAVSASANEFRTLGGEAAVVARAMLNPTVQKCVKEVETSERAKLSVSRVAINQARLPVVKVTGTLIRGGDMAVKEITFTLTPQLAAFAGVVYDCKVERGN